jgi:hypothetical protein
MVKWYEEGINVSKPSNTNKFLVVFEDGTIYTFYKENPDIMENEQSSQKD